MLEVWLFTSFVLAFGIVLLSFRRRDVAYWRSSGVRALVWVWYFIGLLVWWVAKSREALLGGMLVFIAWCVASAAARRVPQSSKLEE